MTELSDDAKKAIELRAKMDEPLRAICVIMDEAKAAGFVMNFKMNVDQFGRMRAGDVEILKPL